jgi:hypothetical protein
VRVAASPSPAAPVPGQSPSAASPIQIADIQLLPNEAVIRLQHTGAGAASAPISLNGWKLQVGSASVDLPSDLTLAPRQTVAIHTGSRPTGSPAAAASPAPSASSTPGSVGGVDVYLGTPGESVRAAMQPGAQVQLIDNRNVVVSPATVPQPSR